MGSQSLTSEMKQVAPQNNRIECLLSIWKIDVGYWLRKKVYWFLFHALGFSYKHIV